MPSLSRHPYRLAAPALLLVLSIAACVSAPAPPPRAIEKEAPAPQPAVEEPEHIPNRLTWKTASEVDNFGFDVYRGDLEDGPFTRLTENPMSGAGTTDLTSEYSWEDTTNDPYRTYYYYVESISLQGVREQFTPIIKAKPKLTRDGEDRDEESEGASS